MSGTGTGGSRPPTSSDGGVPRGDDHPFDVAAHLAAADAASRDIEPGAPDSDPAAPLTPDAPPVSRAAARERRELGRDRRATPRSGAGRGRRESDGVVVTPVAQAPSGAPPRPVRTRATTLVWSLATLVFVAGLVTLGWKGYSTSLELRGAASLDARPKDPKKPGYEAQVRPTEVRLFAHTTAAGALGDLQLLVEGPRGSDGGPGSGGTVIFVPSVLVVTPQGGTPVNLEKLFEEQGFDAVVTAVSEALNAGMTSQSLVTHDELVALLKPAGTLTFDNPDTIYETTSPGQRQIIFPAGQVSLDAEQAVDFLDRYAEGENQIKRHTRGQALWDAWLAALAKTPAPASGDDPGAVIARLAAGTHSTQAIPIQSVPIPGSDGFSVFRPDAAAMGPFIAGAIPFPTAGTPGLRLRVRLLNGTTDLAANLAAVPKVVGAGGQVVLLGNASRFGATSTTVEYSDAALAPRVEAIAAAVGGTAKKVDETSDAFDVTITLGPAVP